MYLKINVLLTLDVETSKSRLRKRWDTLINLYSYSKTMLKYRENNLAFKLGDCQFVKVILKMIKNVECYQLISFHSILFHVIIKLL